MMFVNRQTIIATYLTTLILFLTLLFKNGPENFNQTFLNPVDNSYSVLGQQSVFKEFLGSKRVYAFLPYWNISDRNLNTSNITDLSYFGLNVNSTGRIVTDDGAYKKWRGSQKLSQTLKSIQKLGGNPSVTLVCQDDATIDALLECESCWQDLAQDVKKELEWAGIKDVNLDFEYSGYTSKESAGKYSKLAGYLNTFLDKNFGNSFVVVSAYADSVERSGKEEVRLTDPASLSPVTDAIFIMAYDFHRPSSNSAGPVSPLRGSYSTTKLNLVSTLESYLKVVPPGKLILGLPFYGYDWIVEDDSPMSGRIEGNDTIGYSGVITYEAATDLLIDKRIKPIYHEESASYYFNYTDQETGSNRQVWYDNEDSLKTKVSLAAKNNLLGVGVWALGYEGGYTDLWKAFKSLI